MFKRYFLLAIVISSIFCRSLTEAGETTRVLFIGNSMTYYNTLCNVVKGLAEKKGHSLEVKAATTGGKDLIFHSTAENVITAIKEGKWDIVILQDIVGSFDGPRLEQGADAVLKIVKQYNPNAKIVFYEPWPTKDVLTGKNSRLPYFTHYYIETARKHDAKLAPAAEAFYDIYVNHNLNYYVSDGKHPQPLGTLISASTIYYTIFNEEFNPFSNSDQKFLDNLVNSNVAYTEEGVLKTYDLGILNLIIDKGNQYANAVKAAVADKTGKTEYTSVGGKYVE